MISTSYAFEEASTLVIAALQKIHYIHSLLSGRITFDLEFTRQDKKTRKYYDVMVANVRILASYVEDIGNPSRTDDAKRVLVLMIPLLEFVDADISRNKNIYYLVEKASAKIKLHTSDIVTVADIAILADVTTMGVIQAIRRGTLPAHKIGNTWVINSRDAFEWLVRRA